MKWMDYVKSKLMIWLVHVGAGILLAFFLLAAGNSRETVELLAAVWIILELGTYVVDYRQKNQYFQEVDEILDGLDRQYLLSEVMPDSSRPEDRKYREILRRSSQAVIEEVRRADQEKQDYQEYMECWIHEMKTPLTAIGLICANQRDEMSQKVMTELAKIEHYTETALCYAKSGEICRDFLIGEYALDELVFETIERSRYYLMQNHMELDVDCGQMRVCGDKKWLEFILTQIFLNAVKYRKGNHGQIRISVRENPENQQLLIRDFGVGIPASDLRRIFEKGFTGENGRTPEGLLKASGMGLYLCKRLCDGMGIGITAESEPGQFTEAILTFPGNPYILRNCKLPDRQSDTKNRENSV